MKLSKWLLLGGAAALLINRRRGSAPVRRDRAASPHIAAEPNRFAADMRIDPNDPVQGFDEASVLNMEPLAFDALTQADAEAAQDLAMLETELDEGSLGLDMPFEADLDAIDAALVGTSTGELYGVHTVAAVDTDLPDDQQAFARGENWVEALATSAIENGAEPERELDIYDELDDVPHLTDQRDIPVADRGSAGPGGL
ncbi:MAG: hypothetical protein H0X17_20955 [Deltaproteobacteria bacterium]|nr:hypothetical protein [Deltaproteobacteria bacterium]